MMATPEPGNIVATPCRAGVYVDGFNLYFGLRDAGWKRYYWLDIWRLAENIVRHNQLSQVKYFTAHVKDNQAKSRRQQTYLRALAELRPAMEIIYGHYLLKNWQCRRCGNVWQIPEEKKTDVNIATSLLADAYENRFDVAFLISADSDLVPPIEMIRSLFPDKRILIALPPKRSSKHLQKTAHASFRINQQTLRISQLPNPVMKPDGRELTKPVEWS